MQIEETKRMYRIDIKQKAIKVKGNRIEIWLKERHEHRQHTETETKKMVSIETKRMKVLMKQARKWLASSVRCIPFAQGYTYIVV